MKKLFIVLIFGLFSFLVFGQNEYKYELRLYGGLKVGSEARIASMADVDSIKVSGGELLYYVGATPYYAAAASVASTYIRIYFLTSYSKSN